MNLATKASDRRRELIRTNAVSQAQVDESDAALSRAEAGVSAASATVEAQRQRIAVLSTSARSCRRRRGAGRGRARSRPDRSRQHRGARAGRRRCRQPPGSPRPARRAWRLHARHRSAQGRMGRRELQGNPDRTYPTRSARAHHHRRLPARTIEGVVDSFAPGSGSAFSLLPADNATGNFIRVVQRVPVKIRFTGDPLPVASCPASPHVSRSMAAAAHDHDCRRRGGLATGCRGTALLSRALCLPR